MLTGAGDSSANAANGEAVKENGQEMTDVPLHRSKYMTD